YGGRLRDSRRSRRSGHASEPVRPVFLHIQHVAGSRPFASTAATGSGGMAAQVGSGKPAPPPHILFSRQCTRPPRAGRGSPGGDPTPAGIAPEGRREAAAAASLLSRG